MKRAAKLLIIASLLLALSPPTVSLAADEQQEASALQSYVSDMQPGWNLGNTFDAVGKDETAWGNPRVSQEFIKQIAAQGYRSIRIPITFDQRMASESPYTIDADFLDRVEQVIQWSLAEELYVMINIHHDSWIWLEAGMQDNHDETVARFSAIWTQLADRFKDYSLNLMFESINEPRFAGTDEEKQSYLDELNTSFYEIVRGSGGNNDVRPLVLPTLHTGSDQHTVDALYAFITALDDPNIIATIHYYGFWPFSVNIAGVTTFDDETRNDIITVFDRVHDTFTANGIPVVIGEYGLLGFDTDLNAVQQGEKLKFFEYMIYYAQAKNMTHMLWDNGQHFGRQSFEWSDPALYEMMTTSWETRSATADSDFIYLKQGDNIADIKKKLQLNGNRFVALEWNGSELTAGQDYEINGDELTFKANLLERLTSSDILGTNATLTIVFDRGMDWKVDIIVFTTPELGHAEGTTAGLAIPTFFNGDKLATMEARYEDGSNAGPQNWTPFKEFAYTFSPSYETNEIILKENFFREVNDGIVNLKLHFWSGEVLDYTIMKAGNRIVGNERITVYANIGDTHWARDSLTFLATLGVLQDEGDGTPNPDGKVTRAEFVKLLVETLDLLDETAVSSFSDVEEGAWYTAAVASAEKLELIADLGDSRFGIHDSITRQEAAVILSRAVSLLDVGTDAAEMVAFADQGSISDDAKAAVSAVQQAGILQGKPGGNFMPNDPVTRAEAATLIYRLLVQAS